MNEQEFLASYDKDRFERPTGYTSDMVVFTLDKEEDEPLALKVMVIKRLDHPFKGKWALPGGFVNYGESSKEAAERELEEETGIEDVFLKSLGMYDKPNRDPRGNGWVLSHAFYTIVPKERLKRMKAGSDAEEVALVAWDEVKDVDWAFDHNEIIQDAFEQVKKDVLQTTVAKEFLEKEFSLPELYDVLTTVVPEYKVAKSNFYVTIERASFIQPVVEDGKVKKAKRGNRVSKLFTFVDEPEVPTIF